MEAVAGRRRLDFAAAKRYAYAQSMQLTAIARNACRRRQHIRRRIHDERIDRRPISRAAGGSR